MRKRPTIFVAKESRQDEKRVALVPEDVLKLTQNRFTVLVEDQAGLGAGFTNQMYESAGAKICKLANHSVETFSNLFQNVDIIIRVKRPNRIREQLENAAIKSGTIVIGSLEPLGKNTEHLEEYCKAGIECFSFDQFIFPLNTPMDALKKMGAFAGRLAIQDALSKSKRIVEQVLILGFGQAGQAAYHDCLKRKIACKVITSKPDKIDLINSKGGTALYLSRATSLLSRQEQIRPYLKEADVVIACASSNGEVSPVLVPTESLLIMKPGTVIVDLSITEGGNVEGSQPDKTITLGNGVCVTNDSAYPRVIPTQASIEWSKASYYFINMLGPELVRRVDNIPYNSDNFLI